ncbi:aminodeoxychorismate lyase [Corynebacterium qintianiae]|uniref:Aminodeoxychorismate lyase n=1 Tax=Corynebacterium qintianiae TaxID=2709392 RepID=A0A7T0KLR6_9CORY|nr:aminodeoxychorismate lyase [Corynebacterium qintianiae]QPK82955.1 aminodeoxychorismate lyase [Corynebacterium qintianiae]
MASSLIPPQPVIYLVEPFGGSIRRQNANIAHVYWDDAAVTRGDGIFETLLIHDGAPVNLAKHLARFRRSAEALDLPDPGVDHWVKATREAVADYYRERGEIDDTSAEAKCVWTMTRGRETTGVPTAWLTVRPVDPLLLRQRETGVKTVTAPRGYTITSGATAAPWLKVGAKTLNYAASMAALRWARKHGCDDVIYVDHEDGRVLEATTSTVIIVRKDKKLRTPAPGSEILAGTTQQAIFEYAAEQGWRCKAKDLYVDDLLSAESVWLVSSVRKAVRVTELDGRVLSEPGRDADIRELVELALLSQRDV